MKTQFRVFLSEKKDFLKFFVKNFFSIFFLKRKYFFSSGNSKKKIFFHFSKHSRKTFSSKKKTGSKYLKAKCPLFEKRLKSTGSESSISQDFRIFLFFLSIFFFKKFSPEIFEKNNQKYLKGWRE